MNMCGIIGFVVNDCNGVLDRLESIYENQQSRGRQGAGFAIKRGKKIMRFRSQNPKTALKEIAKRQLRVGDMVLFHHRFPTSSPNKAKFNHPISSEDGSIILIHNGHISNDKALYKRMRATHQFETRYKTSKESKAGITDSEVMVHSLEENLRSGGISGGFRAMADDVDGNFAVACFIKPHNRIFLFKNAHNPIIVSKDDVGNFYFSSELPKGNGLEEVRELEIGELGYLDADGYSQIEVFEGMGVFQKKSGKLDYYIYDTLPRYCRMCGLPVKKNQEDCK
jgi:glucosamine 6-phosphate synthetase-like amidotransferase/phosphosugar isomerase protein